ncbi:MAG: hypothetical protein Q7R81_07020 [Candidatus Peregrinibacteria bacterium]|nr:hypothetical protein [Candidatus Peregrinibacteria bacterium]
MASFSYTAKNPQGMTVRGMVDAIDVQAATSSLQQMNLTVDELREAPNPSTPPSPSLQWTTVPSPVSVTAPEFPPITHAEELPPPRHYLPLLDTLRLYAGWLLAWYFIIYALGSYQYIRDLPFHMPYVEELFLSPVILQFSFAAFLFLLLSALQKKIRGSYVSGIILLILGVGIFVVFRENV